MAGMPRTLEEVERLLRERGFALTRQRRAIVRHLLEHPGHWTARELLRAVPATSRATLYSTLGLLRDLEVLVELPAPGGEVRYDANTDPHQHLRCRRCGRLEDVPEAWLPVRPPPDQKIPFQIERFRVIAEGLCPACQD